MKRASLVLLFVGLISASLLWAQDTRTDQKTITRLEARLQALEQRVTALEKRKEEVQSIVLPPTQLPAETPGQRPLGRPFEFNGQTRKSRGCSNNRSRLP